MVLTLVSLATAATGFYLAYTWARHTGATAVPLRRHRRWAESRSVYFSYGLVLALAGLCLGFEHEVLRVPYVPPVSFDGGAELLNEVVPAPAPPRAEPPPPVEEVRRQVDLRAPIEFAAEELPELELLVEEPVPPAPAPVSAPVPAPPAPPAPAPAPVAPDVEDVFVVVEQMPRFPGCGEGGNANGAEIEACASERLFGYLKEQLRYPRLARDNGVEGTAVIRFVVEADGSITEATVVRDPGAGTGAEALRVVKSFPVWEPGRQRGKTVRVQFTLPVKFRLR